MEYIKELIYKMADDALIFGHRQSEWTGLGPTLEEDIAFSSMAQDKIGHAYNLYKILHENFGEKDPDQLAFNRDESAFKCCHLVELPMGEFDFALVRQFLFDHAEWTRYNALASSSYAPIASFAKKVKGEIKYHILHADTWMKNLGNGNEESKARMQSALNEAFPFALGIFEAGEYESEMKSENIFEGEKSIQKKWLEDVKTIVEASGLTLPTSTEPKLGGRKGYHTEYLQPLIDEMAEVFRSETAEW